MPGPSRWRRPFEPLLMALFPGRCAGCDAALPWRSEDEAFCDDCAGLLERPTGVCPRCALPVEGPGDCASCAADPPPFQALSAAWWYRSPLREAVHAFKLRERPHLYRSLSAGLVPMLAADRPADVLVAVPMTPRALRARGYNPAWLLALGLAGRVGWPGPGTGDLVKVRETAPQRGLGADERRENVRGAFAFRGRLAGRSVLLVDDVVTTGATARECARALLDAGAGVVRVVALARTPLADEGAG